MIIYRAMCDEEADKTIKNKKPDFLRKFKWFSPNLSFITERVQGGSFNNSNHKSKRYTRLLAFTTEYISKSDFVSTNEVQFNRQKNPKIVYLKELV